MKRDSRRIFSDYFYKLLPHLFIFSFAPSCISTAEAEPCARFDFLDAGEGDATVITFPGGGAVLVDAGNPSTAVRIVEKAERRTGQTLPAFIITHPHPDHMGGAFVVKDRLSVLAAFDNGEPLEEAAKREDLYRWYLESIRGSLRAQPLRAGSELRFGEAVLDVLSPPHPGFFNDWNSNSLVLRLSCGEHRVLIMGDANLETERHLLKQPAELRAALIRVGHHGAADATGENFLAAVRPKIAIVSVNRDNVRGYPGAEVLSRLTRRGAAVFRTDESGDIAVELPKDGSLKVQTEKGPGR
jgi:competence protein ComEC